jgi:deoxyribodipyrimidine photolyase-like uncharacterized protein
MRYYQTMFSLSAIMVACTSTCQKNHKAMSAEQVLEAYLDIALNFQSLDQKDQLISYTTGSLEAALAGSPDEIMRKAYLDKRYQVESFFVIKRNDRTPRETEISYHIKYKTTESREQSFDSVPVIDAENTVLMIKEKGAWRIEDVLGNAASFEFPVTKANEIKPFLQTPP